LKQAQQHAKDLSKKVKQLSDQQWNASHALTLAMQRTKSLEESLAQAQRHASDRDAAANRAGQQCQISERARSNEKNEHVRELAKVNQQWQTKVRTMESQHTALEKQLAAARKAAAAASSAAAAAASSAAVAASDSIVMPASPHASSASSPVSASSAITLADVQRLQTELADANAQAALGAQECIRLTQQLEQQASVVAALAAEKTALQQSLFATETALADARSQLSVEQTIVTSLSSAAGDPRVTAWDESASSDALLSSVFKHGYGGFGDSDAGELESETEDGSSASTSSSSSLSASSTTLSALAGTGADENNGRAADNLSLSSGWDRLRVDDTIPLDPRIVAELDAAQSGLLPLPVRPASNVAGGAGTGNQSWSLYSSPSPLRSAAATFVPASTSASASVPTLVSASSSRSSSWQLLNTAPLAITGPSLASGVCATAEQRQLCCQLDALEARIKQLKQQQAEHMHAQQAAPPAYETLASTLPSACE
jgi:hypothetical protein